MAFTASDISTANRRPVGRPLEYLAFPTFPMALNVVFDTKAPLL